MWEAAVSPRHPLDDGARRVFRPARAVFYLAGGTRLSSFRCSLRHILVRIGVFRHLDPVPFIFSGLLLLPLRGLRLRYAIWAFHDFAGSPRCVLLRRGWTLAFWSPGVGSRTLPSRLCGICGSFGLRFALSCFVNSRPGGRSRGFGPRVWWAWACGWDAGGPPLRPVWRAGDSRARVSFGFRFVRGHLWLPARARPAGFPSGAGSFR